MVSYFCTCTFIILLTQNRFLVAISYCDFLCSDSAHTHRGEASSHTTSTVRHGVVVTNSSVINSSISRAVAAVPNAHMIVLQTVLQPRSINTADGGAATSLNIGTVSPATTSSSPGSNEPRHLSPAPSVDDSPVTNVVACAHPMLLASSLPVGGRLRLYWRQWQSIGASNQVVRWLRDGYQLPFRLSNRGLPITPPLRRCPPSNLVTSYSDPTKQAQLDKMLHELLEKTSDSRSTVVDTSAFQPRILGAQEKRKIALSYRSVVVKSMARLPDVSTRSRASNSGIVIPRDVGDVNRSLGRLSTHTDSPSVLAVSGVSGGQQTVPVHGSTVWPEYGATCVLSGDEGAQKVGPSSRHSPVSVPGRLAAAASANSGSERAHSSIDEAMHSFGSVGEFRQIRNDTHTEHRFSRRSPRLCKWLHLSDTGTLPSDLRQDCTGDTFRDGPIQDGALAAGPASSDRKDCAVWSHSLSHAASLLQFSHKQQDQAVDTGACTLSGPQRSVVVDRSHQCVERSDHDSPPARFTGADRCLDDGVGHQRQRSD